MGYTKGEFKIIRNKLKYLEKDFKQDGKTRVYGLFNPLNGELFYIGATKNGVYNRVLRHYEDVYTYDKIRPLLRSIFERYDLNSVVNAVVFFESNDDKLAKTIEKCLIFFSCNYSSSINLINIANSMSVNYNSVTTLKSK